jgi:hypothetical protein
VKNFKNPQIKIKGMKYNDSRNLFTKIRKDVLKKHPIDEKDGEKLHKISAMLFLKDRFLTSYQSGVVIAGFGEDEFFPGRNSITIEGIIDNHVKYKLENKTEIDFKTSASIMPFAQSEMVTTFMEGIDPNLEDILNVYLQKLFNVVYPGAIFNVLKKHVNIDIETKGKLEEVGKKLYEDLHSELADYKNERHIDPILNVVSILPKDELAAMAESLVNLTSFKRKISMDAETVGGPIDVAVISKGDGFVWIKRKHYFKPEFNPTFFQKYLNNNSSKEQKGDENK